MLCVLQIYFFKGNTVLILSQESYEINMIINVIDFTSTIWQKNLNSYYKFYYNAYKLMSQFLKYKTKQKIVIKKFIYYVINVALVTFINTFNKVYYC